MSEITQYKDDVIKAFYSSTKDNKAITFQTANSLIVGKLKDNFIEAESFEELLSICSEKNVPNEESVYNVTNFLIGDFREKSREISDVSQTIKGLWLEDVTIYFGSLNNKVALSSYFLFLDQVVGVTHVDLTEAPQ